MGRVDQLRCWLEMGSDLHNGLWLFSKRFLEVDMGM